MTTTKNLLRKCCDTCHYFWVDAPTRYSQCRQFDIQLDGEDIAFIVRIGCASHSSFAQSIPSSKELIFLATTDFKNREERKGLHDQASWTYDTLDEMIKLSMIIEENETERWESVGRPKNDGYINGSHSGYGHALRDMRQWIDRIKQANGGMKI